MSVRCIVVKLQFVAKKPSYKDYPEQLLTLGDHLRKARLDKGLSQPDVAKILGVVNDTVTCWELNRNAPTAKYARKILEFMEYVPDEWQEAPFHMQLYYARLVSGITQRMVATKLDLDLTTIQFVEKGLRKPALKTQVKIEELIKECL